MSSTRLVPSLATVTLCVHAALICIWPANSYADNCWFSGPTERWTDKYKCIYEYSEDGERRGYSCPKIHEKLLHAKIREGDTEAVNQLMSAGLDPNDWNSRGYSPLHLAADLGLLDIVVALLEGGADPSIGTPEEGKGMGCGRTPLHFAADGGHLDVVTALLGSGADPNTVDFFGETALHQAAAEGHAEVLSALLDSGADRSLKGKEGKTALDEANEGQHYEATMALLKARQAGSRSNVGRGRKQND